MSDHAQPTPFPDVNAVLHDLLAQIQALLGDHFRGMYLYGSLALGDFNSHASDIDILVATDADLGDDLFAGLREIHEHFDASESSWAGRVEAAYIPVNVLRHSLPSVARYPQIERGGTLVREPLEPGWVFQCESLRTHGIAVEGPEAGTLIDPVDRADMRGAVTAITGQWLEQSIHDPDWLNWVLRTQNQSFVVLTLCRMLYSLETGGVASKPAAARWAEATVDQRWTPLITRALDGQVETGTADEEDVRATIALIEIINRRSALAQP